MSHAFQVDLRGVVDLLSHHLYGSPRVYVRELLQNAVDAITARRAVEGAEAPGEVRIEPSELGGDGKLRIHDNGIGLTEPQVHELLATIGRSSKRDDLGFARHEFLGQFGIGLLSCFLVADEVEVITRAQGSPTVRWIGYSDGRYEVSVPEEQRAEQGTTVILTPRRDTGHWMTTPKVVELARLYGSLLPATVHVGDVETTTGLPPWQRPDRDQAMREYAHEHVGVDPFATVDLSVPEAGLTGVAYILPIPANPVARNGHRVYLKRMLLGESVDSVMPDWAFFARCVVDATELRPTASREALYEDGLLETVRESLGEQLKEWLVHLSATEPQRLSEFLAIHRLGVEAMAMHDDDMLKIMDRWVTVETNMGPMPLRDFRERYGVLRYSPTVDQFRQLAAIAAAQNLALINGGYNYVAALVERLSFVDNSIRVERLDPSDLATSFDSLPSDVALRLRPFLAGAQAAMDPLECEAVLRSFEPAAVPAIFLLDRDAAFRHELRTTKDKVDPMWTDVLSALDSAAKDSRPQLVLNYRNPLVRRLTALGDPRLVGTSVEALYGQALLMGYHPMRPVDAALLNRSFLALLERAVPGELS